MQFSGCYDICLYFPLRQPERRGREWRGKGGGRMRRGKEERGREIERKKEKGGAERGRETKNEDREEREGRKGER